METAFKILAVTLAGVAAYFLWQGNADRAFATVVFGAVAFFLSVRFQVKGRLDQRAAEREEEELRRQEEEETEEEETPQLNEMPANARFDNQSQTVDKEPNL